MTKLKTSVLSFGARGTIADSITFQKLRGRTLVRTKPTPANPRSLPQTYHRWDYQDGIFFWNSRSDAQKLAYRRLGSRYHMSAFAYCMGVYLNTLPDLAGRWRSDLLIGALTPDTSKNDNDATVFGAALVPGYIDNAFLFDGTDDYLDAGIADELYPDTFTLETIINLTAFVVHHGIISVGYPHGGIQGAYLLLISNGSLQLTVGDGTALASANTAAGLISAGNFYHIAGTFDGTTMLVYIDGIQRATFPQNPIDYDQTVPLRIGHMSPLAYFFKGIIDNPMMYNRVLTPEQILAHSERRYPLQ